MRKTVIYSIQSPYRKPLEITGFRFGQGERLSALLVQCVEMRSSRCMSAHSW